MSPAFLSDPRGNRQWHLIEPFYMVPDGGGEVVARFGLYTSIVGSAICLYGGKKRGLLENSRDLCKTNRKARVSFTGQNGAVRNSAPVIGTSCGKKK